MDPIEIAKVTPNPSHTPTELKEVLFSHSQSVDVKKAVSGRASQTRLEDESLLLVNQYIV